MTLTVGTLDVVDVRIGATGAVKVMLGFDQVWPAGPPTPRGIIAAVEEADTADIVGTVTSPSVAGVVAAVEAPDVASIVGTSTAAPITGTIAAAEVDDVAAIAATFTPLGVVGGIIAVTEADDIAAITGDVTAPVYTGTIAAVEDDDTATITGDVTAPVYTGVVAATEDADVATIIGSSTAPIYTGTVGVVEDDDVAAIVATFGPTGVVAASEADDTSSIAGTFTPVAGLIFSDNFNRADAPTLGGGWGNTGEQWKIQSNTAYKALGGADYCVYGSSLGTPDHWAEFVLPATVGGSDFLVINARRPSSTDSTTAATAYLGFVDPGTRVPTIGRSVSGTYTTLATGTALGAWPGAVALRIEVQGTAIRLYVNNVLVASTTDSSITTGNYAGLNGNSTSTTGVDNFRCGTLPWTP